jgi:uncharacterized protein
MHLQARWPYAPASQAKKFCNPKIQGSRLGVYVCMKTENFNSCLYRAKVMHHRLSPKRHSFFYEIFMFYLDLDELDLLSEKLKWMSRNRLNLFNFRDGDHLQLPRENPDKSKTVREQISIYLESQGIVIGNGRIMILTNLCTLGYQFNPVSFYFCYDEEGNALCSVVEVGNTFREMKPYFIGPKSLDKNLFHLNTAKDFYVSPFIDLDTHFDFRLSIPDKNLNVRIDDYDKDNNLFFLSTLTGKRTELNDKNLLYYFFSFPLITVKIIFLIHWQAFLLFARKLTFIRKADNLILQKEVFRPYKS